MLQDKYELELKLTGTFDIILSCTVNNMHLRCS